jgi:hypothetical protein
VDAEPHVEGEPVVDGETLGLPESEPVPLVLAQAVTEPVYVAHDVDEGVPVPDTEAQRLPLTDPEGEREAAAEGDPEGVREGLPEVDRVAVGERDCDGDGEKVGVTHAVADAVEEREMVLDTLAQTLAAGVRLPQNVALCDIVPVPEAQLVGDADARPECVPVGENEVLTEAQSEAEPERKAEADEEGQEEDEGEKEGDLLAAALREGEGVDDGHSVVERV